MAFTLMQQRLQALSEREARHRSIFESLDVGFCLIQLLFDEEDRPVDYRFLEANGAFEEHTGLRDAIGKTARELVPDLDPSWFERYGKVALTGEPMRFENHAPAMGGRWFEVNATRVGRPELRQVGLVFRNITERKESEAERERLMGELEASRSRLHSLFETAPAFVATLRGPDHVFEIVNPPYQRMVGKDRRVVGLPVVEALPEVVEQGFVELLDRVYRTGEPYRGREVLLRLDPRGDGRLEEAYLNFVYQPRKNARGAVEGIDAFGFDVTDQVMARKRAEHAEAELRTRVSFEQQLIGIVSHDLRNPINAILLAAAALIRRNALDERSTKSLTRIQTAAERAHRMVRDLLDFTQARLGSGIRVERRPIEIHALVQSVVDEAEATHPGREVRTLCEGDGRGEWDPDRIGQVVQNLVTNALKYSPESSIVRVESRADGEGVTLSVHNEGEPIPSERMATIFEPLQRATEGADKGARSIGLGLYIVKEVVEAHGGTVSLTSTQDEGTTARVRLPARR